MVIRGVMKEMQKCDVVIVLHNLCATAERSKAINAHAKQNWPELPWGTPLVTGTEAERPDPTDTHWNRSVRKLLIHWAICRGSSNRKTAESMKECKILSKPYLKFTVSILTAPGESREFIMHGEWESKRCTMMYQCRLSMVIFETNPRQSELMKNNSLQQLRENGKKGDGTKITHSCYPAWN